MSFDAERHFSFSRIYALRRQGQTEPADGHTAKFAKDLDKSFIRNEAHPYSSSIGADSGLASSTS